MIDYEKMDELPDHRDQLVFEMTGELPPHASDHAQSEGHLQPPGHGLKDMISDMLDYIPMATPLLIGAIQVHCEQIVREAEGIRMAEAEKKAKGQISFFNVEAMIRDADLMLKKLHEGTK